MQTDLWSLYELMLKSRLFEEGVMRLWQEGKISGEMHLGIGEEAIIAGVVSQLREGDAMALDHRGTAAMLMRGVDPHLLLNEFLGRPEGICSGMGGHMHLFSKEHLAASSGIVGASGPAAVGFALAAKNLRPGSAAVTFFGEGAINQGMLLESLNLSVVWELPVLFVCKDDNWSISTVSSTVTSGSLVGRARGFGLEAVEVDGIDVEGMWQAANEALERAREGIGPTFLHAVCSHPMGHTMGDALLRRARALLKEGGAIAKPLLGSFIKKSEISAGERAANIRSLISRLAQSRKDRDMEGNDPLGRSRLELMSDSRRLEDLERRVKEKNHLIFPAASPSMQ